MGLNYLSVSVGRADAYPQVWIDTTVDDTNVWTFDELLGAAQSSLPGGVILNVSDYSAAIVRAYAKAVTGTFSFEIAEWPKMGTYRTLLDEDMVTVVSQGLVLAQAVASFNTSYAFSRHPVLGTAADSWMACYDITESIALDRVRTDGNGLAGTARATLYLDDLGDAGQLGVHVYAFSGVTRAMLSISLLR